MGELARTNSRVGGEMECEVGSLPITDTPSQLGKCRNVTEFGHCANSEPFALI
jgi:hypothetical protein